MIPVNPPKIFEPKTQKPVRSNLPNLTEETIRARTKAGDTPLHRAAKNGQFDLIPSHLLSVDLFMVKNNEGNTPLHVAARHGTLNQVPRQFLARETLTITSTPPYATEYKAQTETVLHIAALYRHGDQIPVEFLTPEYLCIEAKGYGETLLHYLARSKSLDLIPQVYAHSEIWNLKDRNGQTPRDILEGVIEQEKYVAQCRSEPATEKQKEKLRWFGYAFGENIPKGQASDAIAKCVRDYPEKDRAYYNRPATEEQLAQIREYNKHPDYADEPYYDFENEGPLTYGTAKDIIQEWGWSEREREHEESQKEMDKYSNSPSKAQLALLKESGIKLDSTAKITEGELDCILSLEKLPPSEEDLSLFKQHGVISFKGDGFAAYAFGDLIRCFGGSAQDHNRSNVNYGAAGEAAMRDPAYQKPTLSRDWEGVVAFTWPKSKIKEWLRSSQLTFQR